MWSSARTLTRGLLLLALQLTAALGLVDCESATTTEPTGGETHFLQGCDPTGEPCGGDLVCLCNVCTVPCTNQSACGSLPSAQCSVPSATSSCGQVAAIGHCDVSCSNDDTCTALSADHRCVQGACRAPSPNDPSAACAHGTTDANEVLVLGDSFFAVSHQVTAYLENLARSAGTLPVGARFRDNSGLVANGLSIGGNGIEGQYANAVADAPAKVVIMTGGGADALLGSCQTPNADCPVLSDAAAAAQQLLAHMAADAVEHVVYVFYPDPQDPDVRARIDALRPLLQAACDSSPVPCDWVDLRPTFAGHYADYVLADGMNPTAAGSQAAAREIWATMQRQCIAQ